MKHMLPFILREYTALRLPEKSSAEINRGELSYRMMEELCGVRRDFYVPDIKYKMANKANNQLKDHQVPNSLSGQGFYFLFNFFR